MRVIVICDICKREVGYKEIPETTPDLGPYIYHKDICEECKSEQRN
jgi:hypothetical protein